MNYFFLPSPIKMLIGCFDIVEHNDRKYLLCNEERGGVIIDLQTKNTIKTSTHFRHSMRGLSEVYTSDKIATPAGYKTTMYSWNNYAIIIESLVSDLHVNVYSSDLNTLILQQINVAKLRLHPDALVLDIIDHRVDIYDRNLKKVYSDTGETKYNLINHILVTPQNKFLDLRNLLWCLEIHHIRIYAFDIVVCYTDKLIFRLKEKVRVD